MAYGTGIADFTASNTARRIELVNLPTSVVGHVAWKITHCDSILL